MRVGVIVFPGSNCGHDAWYAIQEKLHRLKCRKVAGVPACRGERSSPATFRYFVQFV